MSILVLCIPGRKSINCHFKEKPGLHISLHSFLDLKEARKEEKIICSLDSIGIISNGHRKIINNTKLTQIHFNAPDSDHLCCTFPTFLHAFLPLLRYTFILSRQHSPRLVGTGFSSLRKLLNIFIFTIHYSQ